MNRPDNRSEQRAMLITDIFHTDVLINESTVPNLLSVLAGNGYVHDED